MACARPVVSLLIFSSIRVPPTLEQQKNLMPRGCGLITDAALWMQGYDLGVGAGEIGGPGIHQPAPALKQIRAEVGTLHTAHGMGERRLILSYKSACYAVE